jgi:hypothetical protein
MCRGPQLELRALRMPLSVRRLDLDRHAQGEQPDRARDPSRRGMCHARPLCECRLPQVLTANTGRCWVECMRLSPYSQEDPAGCKVRADEGLDAIAELAPGLFGALSNVWGTPRPSLRSCIRAGAAPAQLGSADGPSCRHTHRARCGARVRPGHADRRAVRLSVHVRPSVTDQCRCCYYVAIGARYGCRLSPRGLDERDNFFKRLKVRPHWPTALADGNCRRAAWRLLDGWFIAVHARTAKGVRTARAAEHDRGCDGLAPAVAAWRQGQDVVADQRARRCTAQHAAHRIAARNAACSALQCAGPTRMPGAQSARWIRRGLGAGSPRRAARCGVGLACDRLPVGHNRVLEPGGQYTGGVLCVFCVIQCNRDTARMQGRGSS